MRPVNRGPIPTRATARGESLKRVIDYSYYRPDLIANLGEYCSYCEVPLGVNLAVEHLLSKTSSLNAEDWDNLLLACTNCNSHKRNKTKSSKDLVKYFWPSKRYPDGFNTYDMMVYRKEAKTVEQLANDEVFLWPPTSRLQNLYPNHSTQTYDQVWVYPSPTYATNQAKTKKIKDTILLMGLNDFTPDDNDPRASDRRVANRTIAWDRATRLAGYLEPYYRNPAGNQGAINLLKAQIKETAIATGFWSVWMTVFSTYNFHNLVNDAERKQLLRDLFLGDAFPGTEYIIR
ncbi:MAG TPA: HNH endonuclease [Blastocatellia bacterium]|nr:HNH endonuclease [Blastocatellia bacterium]